MVDYKKEMGPFAPPSEDTMGQERIAFSRDSYADVGQPIPGSGLPADQVQLKPFDARMLQADPTLGAKEAEVLKARYGGETSTEIKSAAPAPKQPAGPIYDRGRFEQQLFQDMGGNPYEIDPMKEVDRITQEQMEGLFNHVFRGKAIWADRQRLSKKQQDFWQNELRQFRAHVKEGVDSERATKIQMYQFMMGQFENQAKEEEARRKRMGETSTAMRAEHREARLAQRSEQESLARMMTDRRAIIKRQSELMTEGIDRETGEMTGAAQMEFQELANQLKSINQMMKADGSEKPVDKTSESDKQEFDQTTAAPQFKQTEGKPVEVRRTKDGRLLGKMADGSIVELKTE